jgi:hypothetical protein
MECPMNNHRTLILNATGHRYHVQKHRDTDPATSVCMRVNFGQIGDQADEGP